MDFYNRISEKIIFAFWNNVFIKIIGNLEF